ncbi:MAG TPA: hypothetical protein VN088_13200 [Nocardioides sp.]|nr:hypothetical protein [Nocardioides sp.]
MATVDRGPAPSLLLPIVKGASRGFTVLLLGGVVQPWVGMLLPPLGFVWLALVAVAAFVVAARTPDLGPFPLRGDRALIGAGAAFGSYALVLPLVLSAAGGPLPWVQVVCTAATAVVVGATGAALRRD